jgi:hypothetical protein
MEFDSERKPEELVPRTGGGARSPADASTLGARVLALQRQAGNAAVLRALGLKGRTLARDDQPWTFNPVQPKPPDLRPWESKDPAVRARWQEDMRWIANRPSWVKVTVTAAGLKDAVQKPVTAAEAQAQNPPAPTQPPPTQPAQAQPGATQPAPAPVATSTPPVKSVQVQVQYGLAGEAHTKQGGPGADPTASQTDWQSSAQVALTVVYHDDNKPGWEWSTQFQVAWSDTNVLRAMSPTALQSVQIGSQLAYVIPLWNNVQLQIFGQVMFGVTPDGSPVAQAQGGGQLQVKIGKGFSLFLQAGVGGTEGSGPHNAPNYTGDASVQGGIMYQWP